MSTTAPFGIFADGTPITETTISNGRLTARILNWGAVLRDLRLDGHEPSLVLGLNTIEDYLAHSPYMGAMVGRFANRIGGGRFTIDGESYQLDRNENGHTHLHGGALSFGTRPWSLVGSGDDFVTFTLLSRDGESGYPGNVTTMVTYRVVDATLAIDVRAETTAPTLVSIAHHSYFTLDGRPDCRDTLIEIDADAYTPVDERNVPTGEVDPVDRTPFDLREGKPIGAAGIGFDHNYCLAAMPRQRPVYAVRAKSPHSGIALEVWTSEPGVQFYDGGYLNVPVPGLDGATYCAHAGFCLEPQRWPDAPNHRHFPGATLKPGETYRQASEFRFSRQAV